jgi:hypothetical protein
MHDLDHPILAGAENTDIILFGSGMLGHELNRTELSTCF